MPGRHDAPRGRVFAIFFYILSDEALTVQHILAVQLLLAIYCMCNNGRRKKEDLMKDEEYTKLLDRAYSLAPELSASKEDFVIPNVDSFMQGTKTIVRNINTIADKARRKPSEIAKYVSKELAVPVSVEEQRMVISGKFSNDELDKRIKRYFEIYVICRECHKPDTHLEAAGRGMMYLVCEACGARYGVKSY